MNVLPSQPQPEAEPRRASEVLFEELIKSRSSARRENVNTLKSICDLLEKDKVPISKPALVRHSNDRLSYSTLANSSGLNQYIELRATEQSARLGPPTAATGRVADRVQDPQLQAEVRDIESQAKWFNRENVALRALLKNLSPGFKIDAALSAKTEGKEIGNASATAEPHDPVFIQVVLKILGLLIDKHNYRIARGRLMINSKAVLSPSEIDSLRKGVRLTESEWNVVFLSEGADADKDRANE